MICYIKEKSWIAKIAAWKLKSDHVAIVIGNTIHLHNTSSDEFLNNLRWVRHELAHVRQFKDHGFFTFLWKYLVESIRSGYFNNKYEREARLAEKQTKGLEEIKFISS